MKKVLTTTTIVVAVFIAFFGWDTRVSFAQMQNCTATVNSVEALRQALTQAQRNNKDDVICIQAGTYKVNQTLTYITPNGDGGHKLIIRGVGGQVVLDGGNAVQIMRINTDGDKNRSTSDAGGDVRVENITFRNGRIAQDGLDDGGGLHITTSEANVVLTNNTFVGNVAYSSGGGAWVNSESGNVTLISNTFSGNKTNFSDGGARVSSDYGNVTIINNTFIDNLVLLEKSGCGGIGVASKAGNVSLINNTFKGNKAGYGGGACIDSEAGNVILDGNTFKGNVSKDFYFYEDGGGGAVVNSVSGGVLLTNNVFDSNNARQHGGGLLTISRTGKVKIYNNTFYNNRAKNGGGALIILEEDSAEVYVVNNIFWQNTAIAGGRDGDDLFINSNYDEQGRSSVIHLYNNNFSGNANFSSGKSEDLLITKVQQGRYNHAGNVQVDPRFVNASAGDFRLQANSPLIDKGYNNLPSELLQKDRDGNPRVVGGAVDIGAYEFQGRGGGSSTGGQTPTETKPR